MALFSKLFGSKPRADSEAKPDAYKGFAITPAPIKEGGRWRVAARVEKEVAGTLKVHQLIRADVLDAYDVACSEALRKARQTIDEQGEAIFG